MDVEERLNKSEHLEKTYQNAYATDRRLLISDSGFFSKKVKDLDYAHISTITLESSLSKTLLGIGVILASIGWISNSETGSSTILFGGVAITFIGLLYRSGYYVAKTDSGDRVTFGHHRYLQWLWTEPQQKASDFADTLRTLKKRNLSHNDNSQNAEKADKEDADSSDTTTCPNCDEEIETNTNFCPHCGEEI